MRITAVDKNNFTGIPIQNIKVKGNISDYKLYDINRFDFDFLNEMYAAINLKKLMPRLSDDNYTIWDEVLLSAIKSGKNSSKKLFLETCDNTPCGILNYSDTGNSLHLNYVVTYPTKPKNRVPCAGQILLNELLKRFISSNTNSINLQAIRQSPFSPISMYMKLGFRCIGGDDYTEAMRINRERTIRTLAKQKEFLTITPIQNAANEDLSKILNINYE